jgi:hypothetical protein
MRDPFERYVLFWCVENYVPLRQFRRDEIYVAFYESLCIEPEAEFDRLFAFLGKRGDDRIARASRLPSYQARATSAVMLGQSRVDGWRRDVSTEQARRAVEILKPFGLDAIYTEESMPNVEGVYQLMQ